MTATTTASPREVIGALEILRRHFDLHLLVDVFTAVGLTEATGYRRIAKPATVKLGELEAIAERFGVPLHVITEGELATLRYLKEDHPTGGGNGGPGLEVRSSPWTNDGAGQVLAFPGKAA